MCVRVVYLNLLASVSIFQVLVSAITCIHFDLCLQDGEPGVERDVYHFWYTAWPDFGKCSSSIPPTLYLLS